MVCIGNNALVCLDKKPIPMVRPRGFEPLTYECVDRGAPLEVNNFNHLGVQDAAKWAISCPENAT